MKEAWYLLLLLVVALPISAIPVLEFEQENPLAGETVLASIIIQDGQFTREIQNSDIIFLEGRKTVFVEHDILFYNGTHYLVIYTTRPGDFTLRIKEILYEVNGSFAAKTLDIPFNVSSSSYFSEESNTTVSTALSIRPGFSFSLSPPTIKVTNKGEEPLDLTVLGEDISLSVLESHEISFVPESRFSFLEITSYKNFKVPIVYLASGNETYVASINPSLQFPNELFFANVLMKEQTTQVLSLYNPGTQNITNISFSSSQDFIQAPLVEVIPAQDSYSVFLNVTPQNPGHYTGVINISYTQYSKEGLLSIPFSFFVAEQGTNKSVFEKTADATCEGAGGQVCGSLKCTGESIFTQSNEYCCLAQCIEVDLGSEEEGGYGLVIGILILLLLGLIGYAIYKKSKKVGKKSKDSPLKKSVERFAKRMEGRPKSAQGSLQRT